MVDDSRDNTQMGGSQEDMPSTTSHLTARTICERYWKPVYCFYRNKKLQDQDAKDRTQRFFTDLVLEADWLKKFDRTKGSFRAFLLKALTWDVITHRRRTTRDRKRFVALENAPTDVAGFVARGRTPKQAFDFALAQAIVDEAINRVSRECKRDGLERHWFVFRVGDLDPVIENAPAPLDEAIADMVQKEFPKEGRPTPTQVGAMRETVKRRFKAVKDQLTYPFDVHELKRSLASPKPSRYGRHRQD